MAAPAGNASNARTERAVDHWLLPVTFVGTYVLVLLGVYTAAIGAGLMCDARWPLCDGAVFGLFPANWPSFVEWFHRLVAMLVGFAIIGSWWLVWRRGAPRRATWAFTVAIGLLPVQIWLGAQTVLTYEILVLTAHFVTALIIFSGVLAGVVWAYGPPPHRIPIRSLLAASLLAMLLIVPLKPLFLVVHTGPVQVIYYALGLGIITATLLTVIRVRASEMSDSRIVAFAAGGAAVCMALQLVAGRLMRSDLVYLIDWSATAGMGVLLVLALLTSYGSRSRSFRSLAST